MTTAIAIAAVAVVLVILIITSVAGGIKLKAREKAFIEEAGFEPCKEASDDIRTMAADLSQCEDERVFSIRRPMAADCGGANVYYFSKVRRISSSEPAVEFDEFLFVFDRKSDLPVILYMPPISAPEAFVKRIIGPMIVMFDGYKHDRLGKLDIPRELQGSKVLAVFGPKGASIYDLLTPSEISLILSGAEHGAFVFLANKDVAAIDCLPVNKSINMMEIWNYVRKLVEYGGRNAQAD